MQTEEQKRFWQEVERSAREVELWPAWLRGVAESENSKQTHRRCDSPRSSNTKQTATNK